MDNRIWHIEVAGRVYKSGLKRGEAACIYRDLMNEVKGVHIRCRGKRKGGN